MRAPRPRRRQSSGAPACPLRDLCTPWDLLGYSACHASRNRAQSADRFRRPRRAFLVVFGILVHAPDVELAGAGQDVLHGEHGGHHGVILIVVLVHPIAADDVERWIPLLELPADHLYMA